jgi:hypothetical protein
MKSMLLTVLVALVLFQGAFAAPHEVAIGSIGATVKFYGTPNTFDFPDAVPGPPAADSLATTVSGFTTPFAILPSNILGTFTILAISSCGSGCEIADVSSSGGSLQIADPSGVFSADLDWVNIRSIFNGGTTGSLNTDATVNLTNFAYTGSHAGLVELAGDPAGILTATFQFNTGISLTDLTTDGVDRMTSWSATLTTVPEPQSYAVIVAGLAGLLYAVRRRRQSAA